MVHSTSLKVRFGELDPYGHVNHSVYVAWCEAGRGEALESIGLSLHDMATMGWQVVVTELRVRFRRPAVAGDEVVVETWIESIGGATSQWRQRVCRGDDVLCETEVRAGATGLDGRPQRMPVEFKAALGKLLVPSDHN